MYGDLVIYDDIDRPGGHEAEWTSPGTARQI